MHIQTENSNFAFLSPPSIKNRFSIENHRFRRYGVSIAQNFSCKSSSPTNHSSCQKIWMGLSYGIRLLAVDYFVLSQSTRLIERRTDRKATARPCVCTRMVELELWCKVAPHLHAILGPVTRPRDACQKTLSLLINVFYRTSNLGGRFAATHQLYYHMLSFPLRDLA